MSTIFVRTTGNDSTGTGLTGAPYLTLHKALTVAAGGDLILVGDGTYVENSTALGYLSVGTAYASPGITVAPESGLPDKVIVSGSGPDYAMILSGWNIRFDQITFRAQVSTVQTTVRLISNPANVEFRRCRIQARGALHGCVTSAFGASSTASGIRFVECQLEQIGDGTSYGILLDGAGTVTDVQIRDCKVSVGYYGIRLFGIVGFQLHNTTVNSFDQTIGGIALQVGVDGTSGDLCSGTVLGGSYRCVNGHAAVVGAGCDGVFVDGARFYGGVNSAAGQGLVVKQCVNCRIDRCTVYGGYLSGLYFKAAKDCQAFGNTIYSEYANSAALRVQRDPVDNAVCRRLTVRRNVFVATRGQVIDFGVAADDDGGSYVDENVYVVKGTAVLGDVRGTTVTKLTELRAAWSGYDRAVNDRNSRLGQTQVAFGGTPIVDLPA